MKKSILLALALSFLLMLSACGTPSSSTPSDNNSDDKPSSTIPDNTPSNDIPASGSSVTDDFLKTITAETAEAKGVCGADLTWYYQDGVLVIKGTGEMTDCTEDMTVMRNGSNSYHVPKAWLDGEGNPLYDRVGWVIIDNGATTVGDKAFGTFQMLSKVILPETLEKIGEYAFFGCSQLSEIEIPSSVVDIECFSFDYVDLKTATFQGNAPNGAVEVVSAMVDDGTIYYSGTGFDELIVQYSDINWVKQ